MQRKPLIECVPNFSEGRNPEVVRQITDAIAAVEGVRLLDVDPGKATNRTVVTFVGEPEPVVEAAFQAIKKAAELIDMRQHKGEHPRMGATDVCPLVPVADITLEEAAAWAHRLAERVGQQLQLPVFMYEAAATRPERRNLAEIRSGEYEGLAKKLENPDWKPDYGPAAFNAKSGATVIGARDFLVAYNVNLNTKDPEVAQRIAEKVRESGYVQRDEQGHKQRFPGRCPGVKAIGWYMPAYGKAQVSMNITDLDETPLHLAFEACREEAQQLGFEVTGSELIGLAPLRVFLEAGQYLAPYETDPDRLIEATIIHLGLRELGGFERGQRILEDQLKK